MPRQTSIQLTGATERQVEELKRCGFGTFTDIVRVAIDRMYREEGIMQEKMRIDVEFSDSALWGTTDPGAEGYDAKASAEKYTELLTAALRREYPGAEVMVKSSINDRHSVNGEPDHGEVGWVGETISRTWQSWEWMVRAD